jgi:hypothetical protein
MKKSSKKFALSTEAKNDKGFRVRTAGIDISQYQKNPIMLFMHQRPTGKSRDEVGVIGNMVDLYKKDNILWGTPSFDDTDDFAVKLYNKVENDTIRMCSAGLLPLGWSKDEAGDVWLEKSKAIEMSIADIGSNAEAMSVNLCDENGELLTLSSINKIIENFNPDTNMKIIKMTAGAVALGLSATLENEVQVEEAMQKLVELATAKDQQIVKLTADVDAEKKAKETAEADLVALKAETATKENKAFVALAHKQGKFVAADIPKYEKLMAEAPETGKEIIDAMPANLTVMEQLKTGADADNPLLKLTYDELFKSGKLETLKADFPEVFKAKYKAKWGKEYQE